MDCNHRFAENKDGRLLFWIGLLILQIGSVFVIQLFSCFVIFQSGDAFTALNDSLSMLVIATVPAIGSKLYSWHIQDSLAEVAEDPDFLWLDLKKEQVAFPYFITSITAVMIGTMQIVLLVMWDFLISHLDSFGAYLITFFNYYFVFGGTFAFICTSAGFKVFLKFYLKSEEKKDDEEEESESKENDNKTNQLVRTKPKKASMRGKQSIGHSYPRTNSMSRKSREQMRQVQESLDSLDRTSYFGQKTLKASQNSIAQDNN